MKNRSDQTVRERLRELFTSVQSSTISLATLPHHAQPSSGTFRARHPEKPENK